MLVSHPELKAASVPTNSFHILSNVKPEVSTGHRVSENSQINAILKIHASAPMKQTEKVSALSYMSEGGFTFKDDHLGIVFSMYCILQVGTLE